MTTPRILLLTGVPPGDFGVGSVFLRDLCAAYPQDRICCVYMDPYGEQYKSAALNWMPMEYMPAPPEWDWPDFDDRSGRMVRSLRERYYEKLTIPALARRIARYGKQNKVDLLWAPLHSPTTLRLAKEVSDLLCVPLVSMIWDPPAYRMNLHKVDKFTHARLLASFDDALTHSDRCGVASYPMKRRYEMQYRVPCIPITFGHHRLAQRVRELAFKTDKPFIIGIAGQLYAQDEWQAFTDAISSRDWKIAGRKIVIRIFGNRLVQNATTPMNIEFLGYHTTDDTLNLLSGLDAAYLPYWLAPRYSEVVQLCFPTKLSTYIAAGLPVFFHGPAESAVMEFFKTYPVGVGCHTNDASSVLQTLEKLIEDVEFRNQAGLACAEAYQNELSHVVFMKRFAELIGVPQGVLLPELE